MSVAVLELPQAHVHDPLSFLAWFLQATLDLRRQQRRCAPAARSAIVCKAAAAQVAEESPEAVAHQKFIRGSPSKVSPLRSAQDHDLLHQEAPGVGMPISHSSLSRAAALAAHPPCC